MEQKTIKKVKQSIRDGRGGIVTVAKDGWIVAVKSRACFLQSEIDAVSISDFAVHIHLKDGNRIRARLDERYTQ